MIIKSRSSSRLSTDGKAILMDIDDIVREFNSGRYGTPGPNQANAMLTPDGRIFLRTPIMMPGYNQHGHRTNEAYQKYNIPTIMNKPFTISKERILTEASTKKDTFPHPKVKDAPYFYNEEFQKAFTIGSYKAYDKAPDSRGVWFGYPEVTHPAAKQVFAELILKANENNHNEISHEQSPIPLYVSPQILYYNDQPDDDVKRWWFQHVTITDDPAYPKDYAKISMGCIGNQDSCLTSMKPDANIAVAASTADAVIKGSYEPEYKWQILDPSACPICPGQLLRNILDHSSSLKINSSSFDNSMSTNSSGANAGAGTNSLTADSMQNAGVAIQTLSQETFKPGADNSAVKVNSPEAIAMADEIKNLPKYVQDLVVKTLADANALKGSTVTTGVTNANEKPAEQTAKTGTSDTTKSGDVKQETKGEVKSSGPSETEKLLLKEIGELKAKDKKRELEILLLTANDGAFFQNDDGKIDTAGLESAMQHFMSKEKMTIDDVKKELDVYAKMFKPAKKQSADKTQPAISSAISSGSGEIAGQYNGPEVKTQSSSVNQGVTANGNSVVLPYYLATEKKVILDTKFTKVDGGAI